MALHRRVACEIAWQNLSRLSRSINEGLRTLQLAASGTAYEHSRSECAVVSGRKAENFPHGSHICHKPPLLQSRGTFQHAPSRKGSPYLAHPALHCVMSSPEPLHSCTVSGSELFQHIPGSDPLIQWVRSNYDQHGKIFRDALPVGLAVLLVPITLTNSHQVAKCSSDDEDDFMDDDGAEQESEGEAMSDNDSSISDVEGSDPENENKGQAQAIVSGLQAMTKSETKKKYQAGLKYYRHFWARRHGRRQGARVVNAAVTRSGVGKFVLAKRKKTFSWINNKMKALKWGYQRYPRPADATVDDLRQLKAVKDVMKAAKERDANQTKEEYKDRQRGLSQGYTPEQYQQLSEYWLDFLRVGRRHRTGEPPAFTAIHLRTDFLWLNTALGRGQDAVNRELPDQFCYNIPYIGPDVADVFATVTRNGKTNQNGRAEFIGALRHRNVMKCCVGAEAMRSFYRYHVQDRAETSCPDFSSRKAWYDTPVAPGRATRRNPERAGQGLTYTTYYDYFKKAFAAHGITSDKVVHSGRGHGARAAAAAGAKEREIQGLGRWTYAQFDMSYLTTLPFKALVIQAGFNKDWMDRRLLSQTYVIPRSRVRPPEELIQMVFPWLDDALAFVKKRNIEGPASVRDIAAEAVLVRHDKERVIFLQDAAVLWEKWSDLVMYQDPVFKHPLWPRFRQEVLEMCERVNEESTAVDAYNLPAEVAAALRSQEDRIGSLLHALTKNREEDARAQQERDQAVREQLNAQYAELVERLQGTVLALTAQPASCENCGHQQRPQVPAVPLTPATAAPVRHDGAGPSQPVVQEVQPQPTVRYADTSLLRTVIDVRREFEVDNPEGKRSIIWLESNASKTWRKDFKVDRRRLNDLKVIYDGIVTYAKYEGISRETAASKLESWRKREKNSIRQFWEKVRSYRVMSTKKHETATVEVKDSRIERDFGKLLASHCEDV